MVLELRQIIVSLKNGETGTIWVRGKRRDFAAFLACWAAITQSHHLRDATSDVSNLTNGETTMSLSGNLVTP
jgi:hypothetical protein